MKSQTSLVASNMHLQEWACQIRDCNRRPEGMKVEDWCSLNGITKSNYYYRLRRVRQACLDTVSVNPDMSDPDFVELAEPESATTLKYDIAARMTMPSGITLELLNSATPDVVLSIMKACAYVK